MSTNKTHNNCRFCSEISQANGEDPIGSANNAEQYFIIEAAQPWPDNIWINPNSIPQDVLDPLQLMSGVIIKGDLPPIDRQHCYILIHSALKIFENLYL
jgi:hypothetical protein